MSNTYEGGPVSIQAVGSTVTTGAVARSTIPLDSSGAVPRYIRVAATTESYIKLGTSVAVAATTNDILIQPADSLILAVNGMTYISYIQGTSTGKLNIMPLENS